MSSILRDLFQLDIPVIEKILRTVIVYVLLIIGLRLAGKRELAQLNPYDLVVLLLLSNTVQNAIIGADNSLIGGVLGAATLLLVNAIIVRLTYHYPQLNRMIEGTSSMLMKGGKLQPAALEQELLMPRELEAAARKQGFDSLAEIDEAELEPDGDLIFTRRDRTSDSGQQKALMTRLDQILSELAALRTAQAGASH